MASLRLVFGESPDKYQSDDLPDRVVRAFAMVGLAMKVLGDGGNAEKSASDATKTMSSMIDKTGLAKSGGKPRILQFSEMIAAKTPSVMLNAHVLMFLAELAWEEDEMEIIAASLAWVSLGREQAVLFKELGDKLLPHGIPSKEFMRELVAHYQENPDLLWPNDIYVVSKSGKPN